MSSSVTQIEKILSKATQNIAPSCVFALKLHAFLGTKTT